MGGGRRRRGVRTGSLRLMRWRLRARLAATVAEPLVLGSVLRRGRAAADARGRRGRRPRWGEMGGAFTSLLSSAPLHATSNAAHFETARKKSVTAAKPAAPGRDRGVYMLTTARGSLWCQDSLLNQFRLRRSTSHDDEPSTRTVKTSPTTADARGIALQSRSSVASSDRKGRKIGSSGDPLLGAHQPRTRRRCQE